VDADSIDAAREIATTGVLEQAAACGLPTRPVTRIEVVREDIRDAELKRPTRRSWCPGRRRRRSSA
jgi:hypothetical protein